MNQQIIVKMPSGTIFKWNEDLEQYTCAHEEAYIDMACCSPFSVGDSGYVECGCQGQDGLICPASDCTGIQDWEIENIYERVT